MAIVEAVAEWLGPKERWESSDLIDVKETSAKVGGGQDEEEK